MGLRELGSRSGVEALQIDVVNLRFSPYNERFEFGFDPEKEDAIVSLVRKHYEDLFDGIDNFTTADKEFIFSGLVDLGDEKDDYAKSMKYLVESAIERIEDGKSPLIQPLLVAYDSEKNIAFPTDGNRRLMAIVLLWLKGIKVERVAANKADINLKSANAEFDMLEYQLSGNAGKRLNSIELARVLKRMMALKGCAIDDVAHYVGGKNKASYLIKCLDHTPEMQKLVSTGEIAPTTAVAIVDEGLDNGMTHAEITEAVAEAVAEVKEEKENGLTTAKKASRSKILEKLEEKRNGKEPIANGEKKEKTPKQPKPTDEGDRLSLIEETQDLFAELNEMIAGQGSVLPKLAIDQIRKIKSALDKQKRLIGVWYENSEG